MMEYDPERFELAKIIEKSPRYLTPEDREGLLREAYPDIKIEIGHVGKPVLVAFHTLRYISQRTLDLVPYLKIVRKTFNPKNQVEAKIIQRLDGLAKILGFEIGDDE